MLNVEDLNVTYVTKAARNPVVRNVSFEVHDGEMVGLVGESGSGKSAAIHAIAALPRPVKSIIAGRVELDGRDLLTLPSRELRQIHGTELGFVGQNPFGCLQPTLALHKQFHNVLKAHKRTKSKADSRRQAQAALESVGIPEPDRVLAGYAHQLSGGMAQRVVIAIATVLEPKLLIADEPTTALDPTVQIQILDVLADLRDRRGTSVLIVTHDLGVVATYCGRALVMKAGLIVEEGSVQTLFDAASHPYTRELFADELYPEAA
jgi:ABC-type dipeptide/oligopeptide/nickel transport system ATPase component